MDLFDYMEEKNLSGKGPLASRMRPETLDECVGQQHLIAPGKMLYRAIKADRLGSIILYGPPGTGKTTLAHVIANTTSSVFEELSATSAGKKDMEEVVGRAKQALSMYNKKTILFIDEIHRFNKAQQDYLLPFVEDGKLTLIGATTENPYYEVNAALLSRSLIFELKPLSEDDIKKLLYRAASDREKGLGNLNLELKEDAADLFSGFAGGDARSALNGLELAALTTEPSDDGIIHIDADTAAECIQRKAVRYDKNGDQHYDIISAFIKSMRGSDPDAAVFYLAKMLTAGEDIKFIARRIMICASEDVGNADPQAIQVAAAAFQVADAVGMPEARIPLAQAAVYIACAPKSNASYMALERASSVAGSTRTSVPAHLQDGSHPGSQRLGHGIGYKYAHDFPGHYVEQQYLPDEIKDYRFYDPGELGYENVMKKYLETIGKREKGSTD